MRTIYIIFSLIIFILIIAYRPIKELYLLSSLSNSDSNRKCYIISEYKKKIDDQLYVGMTKEEVRSFLGNPQNMDSKNIWFWTTKSNTSYKKSRKWIHFVFTESGYYLIFYNNKLLTASLIKNSEASPWEILQHNENLPKNEIEKLIGPIPKFRRSD